MIRFANLIKSYSVNIQVSSIKSDGDPGGIKPASIFFFLNHIFSGTQTKLKRDLFSEGASNNLSLAPTAYAAIVAPPVLPVRALPPVSCTVMPSVQDHVSVPNGTSKPVRPSILPMRKSMHAHVETGAGQRPSKLGKGAEPATNLLGIHYAQAKDRKRRDIEDCHNDNAVLVPPNQVSKRVLQHKKVQLPSEGTVFNAPKTIEEIRAQKKAKTVTKPVKRKLSASSFAAPVAEVLDKLPVSARTTRERSEASGGEIKSAANTAQAPLEPQLAENGDIEDFDVDVVDDDDFEAQMRALEDAL
jgi:hypothetical protein